MKIQKLRFKNLNSLYGEWEIDFNDLAYTDNGIFALIGPTGAGKSTILDAICLALYGQTPRLKNITKSQNEIMSRHSSSCYAEIIFSSVAGVFICRFEQHKAKTSKNLQPPTHSISNFADGKILENSKTKVLEQVEKKTGMNFEQFNRSMLLAQGKFDAFLKADISEKSSILEQITGTEIYSEISRLTFEKAKIELEKLNSLQEQSSFFSLLSNEQKIEINHELSNQEKEEIELITIKANYQKDILQHRLILNLEKELQEILLEQEIFLPQLEAFQNDKLKLQKAKEAAKADGIYAKLKTIREHLEQNSLQVCKQEQLIPNLEKSFMNCQNTKNNLQNILQNTKANYEKQIPLFQQIRLLDQSLSLQQENISKQSKLVQEEQNKINKLSATIKNDEKNLEQTKFDLQELENWLAENKNDESLILNLAGIVEQLKSLEALYQAKNLDYEKIKSLRKALEKNTAEKTKISQEVEKTHISMSDYKNQILIKKHKLEEILDKKLLREYRTQKDHLIKQKILITTIITLEEHRKNLEDHKPCPLCGSLDHPFAKGNIPELSDIDSQLLKTEQIIMEAENFESQISKLEKESQLIEAKLINLKALLQAIQKDLDLNIANLDEIQNIYHEHEKSYAIKNSEILEILMPLGISEILPNNFNQLQNYLQNKLQNWQSKTAQKIVLATKSLEMTNQLKYNEELQKNHITQFQDFSKTLKSLQDNFSTENNERLKLFKQKNVDAEEQAIKNKILELEKSYDLNSLHYSNAEKDLQRHKVELLTLNQQNTDYKNKINKLDQEFNNFIFSIGFENESKYLEAKIPQTELNLLEKKQQALEKKKYELEASKQEKETKLRAENNKSPNNSLENLSTLMTKLEEDLKNLYENITKNKLILQKNLEEENKSEQISKKINLQSQEAEKFAKLNKLIGSADGKKYRNFAQGLTFDALISNANKQLEKMSDRYLLIHNRQNPLIINVVDNYHGSEIRPTTNLSGGESFIISLSLALGLSKLASQKVRVDSLFLDEGFGTLDDESLETAISTLANLQEDGKLIGIISHVAALKERIVNQIQITPLSNGRSTISGAGCIQIS